MGSSVFSHDIDMGVGARGDREHERGLQAIAELQARNERRRTARQTLEERHEEFFAEDELLRNPSEFTHTLGYQHGYNLMPVDYAYLAIILKKYFPRATHPDVDPEDYEGIYTDGHMSGDQHRRERDSYAVGHGAERGPAVPDVGLPMTI